LEVDPTLIAAGVMAGITTSVVAAWIPARNAARVDPVQALQKGKYQVLAMGENRRRRWMALTAFLIASVCLLLSDSKPLFYTGYVAMMGAGLLLAPALTLFLSKGLRPVLRRLLPAEGTLAADSLVEAPRRTSATVSALMLSLAMVVGLGGFGLSFFSYYRVWVDNAIIRNLFITSV